MKKATIDKLKSLNIPTVPELTPSAIKKLRRSTKASQGVFAALLNVNPSTIQKWEQGSVKPQKAALKLLHVLKNHGINALLR
jgi:putative transcriptional regulator